MGNRDQLRSSLEKEDKPGKRGPWRSKAYHRFFEGYTEITVPNPDGKGSRIKRIYTGNYYRQDLTDRQRILLRLLYVALYLGAVYLFVSSAVLPLASNSTWYVVLTQVVSIPLLFWILIVFFSYLPTGLDLTIHDYRISSLSLQKAALYAAISMGIVALVTLLFILLNRPDEPLLELFCAVKYLAGALLVLVMSRVEKKVNYLIIPSPNKLPDHDVGTIS